MPAGAWNPARGAATPFQTAANASLPGEYSSRRLATVSDTSSPPAGSAPSPRGAVIAPRARPEAPKARKKAPCGSNTSTRPLAVSAT